MERTMRRGLGGVSRSRARSSPAGAGAGDQGRGPLRPHRSLDVGKPYAQGVQGRRRLGERPRRGEREEEGAARLRRLRLQDPGGGRGLARLVADEKVIMINGWGTGDTLALAGLVNRTRSRTSRRPSPATSPTLEDALQLSSRRATGRDPRLAHLKGDWKDKSRNPKVAFFYGDNAHGKAPIEAAAASARRAGIDPRRRDRPRKLPGRDEPAPQHEGEGGRLRLHQRDDDGRVAHPQGRQGPRARDQVRSNPYGFSEALPAVVREAAEGVMGVMLHVPCSARTCRGWRASSSSTSGEPPERHARRAVCPRLGVRAHLDGGAEARRQGGQAHGRGRLGRGGDPEGLDFSGPHERRHVQLDVDHRLSTKTPIYQVRAASS